jgi:membrane fusion protein, multidrug efflux system
MGKLASAFHRHRRPVRYLIVIGGLLLIVAVLVGIKASQIGSLMKMGKQMQKMGPPPEAVASAVARAESWETTLSAVGSISGLKSVAVSNEAPGIVTRIRFESGRVVKQGEVLVELDTDVERAQRASAQARRELAVRSARRQRAMAAEKVITPAELDESEAQLKTAESDLAAISAQLDRKVVRAPFKGRLGIRAVNVGQYLGPGTTITTLDAIGDNFVDFTLPQEEQASISVGLPIRVTMEGAAEPIAGTITAIDPTVDPVTRHLRIRGKIAVDQVKTRPGMFVKVQVIEPKRAPVVAVPATAIIHASYGDSVFAIEPKKPGSPGMDQTPDGKPVKIARQQFVRVGGARGDFVAIHKGLKPGQELVSAGAFKLRNGSPVVVDNRIKVNPQLDPKPENR